MLDTTNSRHVTNLILTNKAVKCLTLINNTVCCKCCLIFFPINPAAFKTR